MCLRIRRYGDVAVSLDFKEETKRLQAETKPIFAYKVLHQSSKKDPLTSLYQGTYIWHRSHYNISNRPGVNPTRLTRPEIRNGDINRGLHFLTTREAARQLIKDRRSSSYVKDGFQIWIVKIQPEDIVHTGLFEGAGSIVAHKAKLVRRVR